jgi:hypothetical protein
VAESQTITTAEVQKARAFLYGQHKRGFSIPPRKFAQAAKEQNVSFRELLRFIAILQSRGQGQQAFRMENLSNISAGVQQ